MPGDHAAPVMVTSTGEVISTAASGTTTSADQTTSPLPVMKLLPSSAQVTLDSAVLHGASVIPRDQQALKVIIPDLQAGSRSNGSIGSTAANEAAAKTVTSQPQGVHTSLPTTLPHGYYDRALVETVQSEAALARELSEKPPVPAWLQQPQATASDAAGAVGDGAKDAAVTTQNEAPAVASEASDSVGDADEAAQAQAPAVAASAASTAKAVGDGAMAAAEATGEAASAAWEASAPTLGAVAQSIGQGAADATEAAGDT